MDRERLERLERLEAHGIDVSRSRAEIELQAEEQRFIDLRDHPTPARGNPVLVAAPEVEFPPPIYEDENTPREAKFWKPAQPPASSWTRQQIQHDRRAHKLSAYALAVSVGALVWTLCLWIAFLRHTHGG